MLDLNKIRKVDFAGHYYQEEHPKNQIYLHHTAGNGDGVGVANYWKSNSEKIATAFIISDSGEIVQCFGSKYYAYHLGLKKKVFTDNELPYLPLDKTSIGIEICNYGQLKKNENGKYINWAKGVVKDSEVIELEKPFRGYKYWQNYTDKQIEATKDLLVYLCDKYKISKVYNEDIWDVNKRALKGENGIFTHNSVRFDKTDIYPHPKMIEMLKSL